jgi:hypothetical protein
MAGPLFFVCPTDYLEGAVRRQFGAGSFFSTSLGNSTGLPAETIEWLSDFLGRRDITHVTFVLSSTNRIIGDALSRGAFRNVRGVRPLYTKIRNSALNGQPSRMDHLRLEITRAVLRDKAALLLERLPKEVSGEIQITTMLYNPSRDIFLDTETVSPRIESFLSN